MFMDAEPNKFKYTQKHLVMARREPLRSSITGYEASDFPDSDEDDPSIDLDLLIDRQKILKGSEKFKLSDTPKKQSDIENEESAAAAQLKELEPNKQGLTQIRELYGIKLTNGKRKLRKRKGHQRYCFPMQKIPREKRYFSQKI